MRTQVRVFLRRRRRNDSDALGLREFEVVPDSGDEVAVVDRGIVIHAVVMSVLLQALPNLDGLLIPLLYLAEL